ncbi:MAG: tryptophan--tRNA ligase [Candidatus Pacebacteria bacterium]|nr:tryptophan--tRNA ligase [Candidatus Paceibacterota bacterium]
MNKKNIIVSGIQPSGELHIGNYLGALKNFVKLQTEDYACIFFIADLHSMTINYDTKEKAKQTMDLVLDYLAAGLDPEKSTIYIQSQVPVCTELTWVFNTVTPVAELERMTQFKDKTQKHTQNINVGLLDYPVLMAADILINRGNVIPVGQDQFQHVELTRKIARYFNNRFGQTFEEPKEVITNTPKIMSLADPTKKMSKSHGPKSYIAINDSPETIANKMKKAVSTTEYDKAVYDFYSTLLEEFGSTENQKYFAAQFKEKDIKFSELKKALAEDIAEYFKPFREKRAKLEKDPQYVREILKTGAAKAEKRAQETMKEVRKKIGLLN